MQIHLIQVIDQAVCGELVTKIGRSYDRNDCRGHNQVKQPLVINPRSLLIRVQEHRIFNHLKLLLKVLLRHPILQHLLIFLSDDQLLVFLSKMLGSEMKRRKVERVGFDLLASKLDCFVDINIELVEPVPVVPDVKVFLIPL